MAVDDTDAFLERRRLRRQVTWWRVIAAVVAVALIALAAYRGGHTRLGGPYVARLDIEGMILDDPARDRALRALRDDSDVAAVIVRIDSPGGTFAGSEALFRNLRAVAERRPVVAVMAETAASGGYMTALAADHVIAREGTITGSIGVLAGKATLQGLYGHLGITKDVVHRGDHAAIHSDYLPLSESERGRIQVEARTFYDDFLGKVAAGRGLSVDSVAAVAEGRVWTGQQALERGLVDQLGGLDDAIDEAKVLAGIARDALVPIVRLPRPRHGGVLSLLRWLPVGAAVQSLSPWLGVSLRERVWAVMPFQVRFF